jgi:kynurenine formamidase
MVDELGPQAVSVGEGRPVGEAGDALPTEADVRGYLTSLSNWGRWGEGADGLRGTLNLITPDRRAAAARLVERGRVVGCGLPMVYEEGGHGRDERGHLVPGGSPFAQHYMLGYEALAAVPPTTRAAPMDGFLIEPHGQMVTHLDAPAHVVLDGRLFNGVPLSDALGPRGARLGGVELSAPGIVGRGVLLDVALARGVPWLDDHDVVLPADLDRAEERYGAVVGPGDCLVVRTGYRLHKPGGELKGPGYARPGLQAACLPWLRERDVAVVCSDVPSDCWPHGYDGLGQPIHTVGLWAIGLWLIDNCAVEELAAACADEGRNEFLFTVAPLVLTHGTASPVNPLAVF